jgi:hypothetical protein
MQFRRLQLESLLRPYFHVNLTTYFDHTEPSSGIYYDLCKLLHCTLVLHKPRGRYTGCSPILATGTHEIKILSTKDTSLRKVKQNARKKNATTYIILRRINTFFFKSLCILNFNRYQTSLGNGDSSFGIAVAYGLDDRGVAVRVLVGSRIFSPLQYPGRFWGTPNFLVNGYQGTLSPRVKRPRREADH